MLQAKGITLKVSKPKAHSFHFSLSVCLLAGSTHNFPAGADCSHRYISFLLEIRATRGVRTIGFCEPPVKYLMKRTRTTHTLALRNVPVEGWHIINAEVSTRKRYYIAAECDFGATSNACSANTGANFSPLLVFYFLPFLQMAPFFSAAT